MNERIRELAEQATIITSYQYQTWGDRTGIDYKEQFDKEKFAELIVRECIGVVNKRYTGDQNREDMEVRRCVGDLKKHFGVEE